MHQIHVQVVRAKVGQRLFARRDHIFLGMLVVPQLGRDPKLLARKSLKNLPDTVFVVVDRGTVEMPVADFQGTAHRLSDPIGWYTV
jgi:hypothetical protein